MRLSVFGWLALVGLGGSLAGRAAGLEPLELRCEYRVNPQGIDTAQPRLTWQVRSSRRGASQAAYEILVASSLPQLDRDTGDLWDSGRVAGGRTVNIAYAGKPLVSRESCFWKVRVWSHSGQARWSQPAAWTMGLLQPADWQGRFISFRDPTPVWTNQNQLYLPPARQYRKEFAVGKTVRRATIYATALGIYELWLNGHRVGDARFDPGWTDYRHSVYYNTYDVTSLLKRGPNAIGAWVAGGWYSGYLGFGLLIGLGPEQSGCETYGATPALLAQLEVEYTDGTRATIPTNPSWKETGDGPVREADFLMGESYDARKETTGWTQPGFADGSWLPAILASENGRKPATFYEFSDPAKPGDKLEIKGHPVDLGFQRPEQLEAFPGVPVRPRRELQPVAVTSPAKGVYIFNFGQNFAGVARLKVHGPAGAAIRLRYGEMLHADGTLMSENLRKARATDYYVLRGAPGGEVYEPRFTYHGFQYVEVTGYPGQPGKDAVTGVVLGSDTALTSGFECSDPAANRLFKNIVWTQRNNFMDLPTDCPQRDERFGWTGDAQIYVHTATLNADVAAFYTKWLRELMASQRPDGVFPGYAPYPYQHGWGFGAAWCDAGVICPYTIWQAYDDTRIIKYCWPFMVRFMDWRQATSRNNLGVVYGNDWGDWLSFGPKTPLDYVDTVYYAYSSALMSQMAAAIGRPGEAAAYGALAAKVKAAFAKKYLKPDGSLTVDTQTAYALALFMDLIPPDLRIRSGRILADKLRAGETAHNSGMTTGFLGTRPLLPVLTSVGENDLAVKHFQSRKFPSWGYEVAQGATTIWEHWDSYTKSHGFGGMDGKQNASMNSFDHYSFGAVGEWMLNDLAGIQSDGPGYAKIIIHPHPPAPDSDPENPPINWVKAHYDSIHGRIVSNWRLRRGRFELDTTIPPDTTAIIYLPTSQPETITESHQSLRAAKDVRLLNVTGDCTLLAVGAGVYHFATSAFSVATPGNPGAAIPGSAPLDGSK